MTVIDPRAGSLIPELPEVLAALEIAASAQAAACGMIQDLFGADGSALHHPAGGALVPEASEPGPHEPGRPGYGVEDAWSLSAQPTVQDLREVLAMVNTVTTNTDRLRGACADMILAGSDPFIDKDQRISDRLGERSPEATIKKYLLHSPKQLHDIKAVRAATTLGRGFSLSPVPALLPVLTTAVTAGSVTLEQAEAIATALTPVARRKTGVDPDALATAESILVGHATGGRCGTPPDSIPVTDLIAGRYGVGMHPEELRRLGRQLAELVDQDGPEPSDADLHAKRGLTLKPGKRPGDPARLTATLTPEAYEQLTVLLASILDPKTGATPATTSVSGPDTDQPGPLDRLEPTTTSHGSNGAGGCPFPARHAGRGTGAQETSGRPDADSDSMPGLGGGSLRVTVEPADGTFHFADTEAITFPQAQHDAFVTLMGLAAKTAPDQGGAPPRVILLARAEQVLRTINTQAYTQTDIEDNTALAPVDAGARTDKADSCSGSHGLDAAGGADAQVTNAVGQAITALSQAGRAGYLTDHAIRAINTLITLLNQDHIVRRDDPSAWLAAMHQPPETGTPPTQGTTSPPPVTPVFGASLLQDPRLLTSALLPATATTIPLTRLGEILCNAITETITTKNGDFLSYSVTQHRTFTPAQRRVLLTTYTTCAVPDCHTPGLRCDAHHIHPASHDGPTTITNGVLLCRHHHTKLHQGHLTLQPRPPGIPGLDAT